MISHLRGIVLYKHDRLLILDVGGVGYRIATTPAVLDTLPLSKETSIWTHLAVREHALDLYGFTSKDDLELFELLITVSGIGPKTALGVLSIVLPETIRLAISREDSTYLTKVSGVGKKIAEKIVLELKGKYETNEGDHTNEHLQKESDAIEALKSLGYNHNDAREALKKVSRDVQNTSEKVKQALKILSSQ